MSRSLPRALLCVFAAAFLLSAGTVQARDALRGWQAVLVAGDNAQPVFDNAIEAMAGLLAMRGITPADIHLLSASRSANPSAEPANAEHILARIAGLHPAPGQGCFIFITSHGQHDEGIWLAQDRDFLRPGALARALAGGCANAPTVAVLSSCYSGAFTSLHARNRIVITAARADRPSFGCQADRTYTVFDECLLGALQRGRTWRAVFDTSAGCVQRREQKLRVLPSQPQASFGSEVRDLPVP
jgi:hypothetical protein